ncbi:hypothetical protein L1889_03670 [Paenalcaligenes niemegkensis]|uniref:hypothetical protein n=1 Tax=Paenalcaligenes niemegkensis TaxID=2895469 RepID=UPI001EE948CF|nr:hypothetical protein [Paenalcaligenes niemegkensis]MCQ9615908.1 hypothetical protein [Paenalcaligenes niemegkensis]
MLNNNQQLRELFTLPPIQPSASTALAIPDMPPQQTVTGDHEVDAVLWLQSVVKTGNQGLIDKALEAAKQIKTPMKVLSDRYAHHASQANPKNTFAVLFATMGFGELEKQAKRAIEQASRRHEALSRFGDIDALFANTPAEDACVKALNRAKKNDRNGFVTYDEEAAAKRFAKHPALVPTTIDDCLYAMEYSERLYFLRGSTVDYAGDTIPQVYAHETYCFTMMASIQPRDEQEAMRAFEYLQKEGRDQWSDAPAIYRNLIVSGWTTREVAA